MMVTVAAGIFILPFFLFSATAGQIADKYEKSRLKSIIKFFEIIVNVLAASAFIYKVFALLICFIFIRDSFRIFWSG